MSFKEIKVGRYTITRDSLALKVVAIAGLIAYLQQIGEPPTQWDYQEWLTHFGVLVGWVSAWLSTSMLRGKNDRTPAR